ncbi:MAG: NAD(P)-dependent oxidoreductase [Pseudomonadota bacterium]|nr:NAD(P)-dependent oxidoreductase [Pseudomonadota bacterium]
MSIFVIGGTGFIGSRLTRALAKQGETIVCMDINPHTADFSDLEDRVSVVRGDMTQFDDVLSMMAEAETERVINLSYFLGNFHPPHVATKLNVIGMDNCFEASRILGVKRVVYASSLAVYGKQHHYGERPVTEEDYSHGHDQYAMHKIFNEWQAEDYMDKYDMSITGVRPTNVTGPDKVRGSIDHVNCITQPARGNPVSFPYADFMRLPIHVDDITEVFKRVLMADDPQHAVYNSGGTSVSMGDIAEIVRDLLPDADITFENETGGYEDSSVFLMDNSRLVNEFGLQYRPYPERVLQIINEVRSDEGLSEISI